LKSTIEPQEQLAKFSFINANRLCSSEHGCRDYHKAWTTLRYLNTPGELPSESEFFVQKIKQLRSLAEIRILVSGAADTGLTAMVLEALTGVRFRWKLIVVDQCQTVIEQHLRFQKHLGVEFELIESDILNVSCEPVDIVIAHNFSRFLPKQDRLNLFAKWSGLLKENGHILFLSSFSSADSTEDVFEKATEREIELRIKQLQNKAKLVDWLVPFSDELSETISSFSKRDSGTLDSVEETKKYFSSLGFVISDLRIIYDPRNSSPQSLKHGKHKRPKILIMARKPCQTDQS
jgi:hypothetical protein